MSAFGPATLWLLAALARWRGVTLCSGLATLATAHLEDIGTVRSRCGCWPVHTSSAVGQYRSTVMQETPASSHEAPASSREAPSSSRDTHPPPAAITDTLYSLKSDSHHFAHNFNDAFSHARHENKGKFLSIASINLGGKRKSDDKNEVSPDRQGWT